MWKIKINLYIYIYIYIYIYSEINTRLNNIIIILKCNRSNRQISCSIFANGSMLAGLIPCSDINITIFAIGSRLKGLIPCYNINVTYFCDKIFVSCLGFVILTLCRQMFKENITKTRISTVFQAHSRSRGEGREKERRGEVRGRDGSLVFLSSSSAPVHISCPLDSLPFPSYIPIHPLNIS